MDLGQDHQVGITTEDTLIMCAESRCDMATMAHMLATEIYAHRPDPDQADTARVTYNLCSVSSL